MTATHVKALPPRRERGQSLVEFGFMAIVLLTLLMGIIDLARAYFTYLALKDAAQEGTYYGSVYPRCFEAGSIARCADPNNIVFRIKQSAPIGGLVDWTDADITHSKTDMVTPEPGDLVTVTVAYNYTLITPVIGGIIGSQSIPLSARSVAVIISNKLP